jgi:hypothetical protein
MLNREHTLILLQGISVVLALHFAKGSMTGEYRNLMAVVLVAVVLMAVERLVGELEGFEMKFTLDSCEFRDKVTSDLVIARPPPHNPCDVKYVQKYPQPKD